MLVSGWITPMSFPWLSAMHHLRYWLWVKWRPPHFWTMREVHNRAPWCTGESQVTPDSRCHKAQRTRKSHIRQLLGGRTNWASTLHHIKSNGNNQMLCYCTTSAWLSASASCLVLGATRKSPRIWRIPTDLKSVQPSHPVLKQGREGIGKEPDWGTSWAVWCRLSWNKLKSPNDQLACSMDSLGISPGICIAA